MELLKMSIIVQEDKERKTKQNKKEERNEE